MPTSSFQQRQPERDCPLCPRLVAYRQELRATNPDWFNAPVQMSGSYHARFVIIGLAPGRAGANRTGRAFTGDGAGDFLFPLLARFGFTQGIYDRRPDDKLQFIDCAIINSVRCVPPQNRPTGAEIRNCRRFLKNQLEAMSRLRVALALGRIAHESALYALGARRISHPFGHGTRHELQGLTLYDSYHCSRYNTNTGRLTEAGFAFVLEKIRHELDEFPDGIPPPSHPDQCTTGNM